MLKKCFAVLLVLVLSSSLVVGSTGSTSPEITGISVTDSFMEYRQDPLQFKSFLATGTSTSIRDQAEVSTASGNWVVAENPSAAFLRSLVLPGWGQRYAGSNLKGGFFTAVEIALWTGAILNFQSSKSLEKNYQSFASQHAGINGERSEQFYVDMGQYDTRDEFNTAKRNQRNYDLQYRGDDTNWIWDSSANREQFKDMRIRSDQQLNNVYYFVGGMLLNRLVSGIDAARTLAEKQKSGGLKVGYNLDERSSMVSLVWNTQIFN